jgi:hypothetical protein
MGTRYYFLKIDTGNRGADKWLGGDDPLKCPAVPIYFDKHEEEVYRGALKKPESAGVEALRKRTFEGISTQALAFGLARHSGIERTVMVVIYAGRICVLQPSGKMTFLPVGCDGGKPDCTTKAMPVGKLVEKSLADVPAVLRTWLVHPLSWLPERLLKLKQFGLSPLCNACDEDSVGAHSPKAKPLWPSSFT